MKKTLCFGCSGLRSQEDLRLLDEFAALGGFLLDTANSYGDSEVFIGQWLHERKNRDKVTIITKVGFNPGKNGVWQGLNAKTIEEQCERSLKRLRTDHIDIYLAHCDDRETPLEETLEAFDRLAKKGKIRTIGACNLRAWRLEKALNISRVNHWETYSFVQQGYSYLPRNPGTELAPTHPWINNDLLDCCLNEKIQMLAYSPLLGGVYGDVAGKLPENYDSPFAQARMRTLRSVAEEIGATPAQVVLAWLLNNKPPIIPVVRTGKIERLRENFSAINLELTQELMRRLSD